MAAKKGPNAGPKTPMIAKTAAALDAFCEAHGLDKAETVLSVFTKSVFITVKYDQHRVWDGHAWTDGAPKDFKTDAAFFNAYGIGCYTARQSIEQTGPGLFDPWRRFWVDAHSRGREEIA